MQNNSRSRKALYNTTAYLFGVMCEVIISLIIPRLILGKFGSNNNGLTASIEQFLSYTSLLYLGLTGVTRAALYKPLSEYNDKAISSIMSATQVFMKKVTIITMIMLVGFSCVYPYFVSDEFSWGYAASLTFIIGINTLFQYYFAMPCRIILAADQKNYILTIVDIVTLVLSSLVSVVLIFWTNSIHLVKLGSICIRIIGPVFLHAYVKKHYSIDYSIKPDISSINQRRDASAHSIAAFIHKNTDIVILTMFMNVREISVYTIYYLVINGLNKIGTALSSGLEGAFGNIIAKNQVESLKQNVSAYETAIVSISSILYASCAILIVPFVKVYTLGINDVSYDRIWFGYFVSLAGLFSTIRIPYQTIVQAAGKYRETRNGAILEAVINIILSVILVFRFGLVGVTVGTVVAMFYRTVMYAHYAYKNITYTSYGIFWKRLGIMVVDIFIILLIANIFPVGDIKSYVQWLLYAIPVFSLSVAVVFLSSYIFWKKDIQTIVMMIKRAIR